MQAREALNPRHSIGAGSPGQSLANPNLFPEAGGSVDKTPISLPSNPPAPTTSETLATPTTGKVAA